MPRRSKRRPTRTHAFPRRRPPYTQRSIARTRSTPHDTGTPRTRRSPRLEGLALRADRGASRRGRPGPARRGARRMGRPAGRRGSGGGRPRAALSDSRRRVAARRTRHENRQEIARMNAASMSCRARRSSSRRRKTAPPTRGTPFRANGATWTRRPTGSTTPSSSVTPPPRRRPRARRGQEGRGRKDAPPARSAHRPARSSGRTKRATADDLTLREADKAARDLRTAIETPLTLPHHERD